MWQLKISENKRQLLEQCVQAESQAGHFSLYTSSSIRYNVAQLEQWARDQKIEDTGTRVIDTLLPVIQVTGTEQILIKFYTNPD